MTTPSHDLKTDPDVFQLSWDGLKDYEIRYNDRNYQVGDHLMLRETKYSGAEMALLKDLEEEEFCVEYTGRVLDRVVTHVLSGYGLGEGWVILSVKPVLIFRDSVGDIEESLLDYEKLNCPACGGSGHVEDAAAAIADTARLDYMDQLNAENNARYKSNYGWGIDWNHNRIALIDHVWPKRTVREAIDHFKAKREEVSQ